MRHLSTICAVAFALSSGICCAQTKPPPEYGVGSVSCATYQSDYLAKGYTAKALYFSWSQGFITASNALLSGVGMVSDLKGKISPEQQQKLLDDICRSNPQMEFSRASMKLLDKLREAEGLTPLLQ